MNLKYLDGLNSEIRKQARFIDSRKEVIPLEKSVLIQYCDMQAEIKELRRLIKMTEERLEKIEKEGVHVLTIEAFDSAGNKGEAKWQKL